MKRILLVVPVFVLFALLPPVSSAQSAAPRLVAGSHTTHVSGEAAPPPETVSSFSAQPVTDSSNLMVVAPTSGPGLVINATMDSSITSNMNSTAIQNAINAAISVLQARFKDPITVYIYFRYAATKADNITLLSSGTLAQSNYFWYTGFTWSSYVGVLTADATTANDSVANAHLPLSSLSTNVNISSGNGRAIGQSSMVPAMNSTGGFSGPGNIYDGIVTLNSGQPFQFTRPTSGGNYDAQRAVEHEIDEILGLGSLNNSGDSNYRPQDIFSFSAAGVRSVLTSGSRYFSIDGGVTNIVGFNQDSNGDFGDWLSGSCPQTFPYVQNAFGCSGQFADVTATSPEGINLDVIGYDLVPGSVKADFNGDGKSDVIWRKSTTGEDAMWLMNGVTFSSAVLLPTVSDTNWKMAGVGDFNGDGKADVIWLHNLTGQVVIWLMNGTSLSSATVVTTVADTNWKIAGVGDVNNDGKADVIWRNQVTGQVVIWLMNGTTISSAASVTTVSDLNWNIVGVGDFNGDGLADIFWRNGLTGQNVVWLMNGTSISSATFTNTVTDPNYKVVGVGDVNGDGKADVVWWNQLTGDVVVWLMNGATISSAGLVTTVSDVNWHVEGVGDFDGDGKADLIWRKVTTGDVVVWLMNGLTIKQGTFVTTVNDLNWSIVAPR